MDTESSNFPKFILVLDGLLLFFIIMSGFLCTTAYSMINQLSYDDILVVESKQYTLTCAILSFVVAALISAYFVYLLFSSNSTNSLTVLGVLTFLITAFLFTIGILSAMAIVRLTKFGDTSELFILAREKLLAVSCISFISSLIIMIAAVASAFYKSKRSSDSLEITTSTKTEIAPTTDNVD